jgi:hypothetical protein
VLRDIYVIWEVLSQREQSLRRDTPEPRGSRFFSAAGCRRVAPARRFVTRFKQIHPPPAAATDQPTGLSSLSRLAVPHCLLARSVRNGSPARRKIKFQNGLFLHCAFRRLTADGLNILVSQQIQFQIS